MQVPLILLPLPPAHRLGLTRPGKVAGELARPSLLRHFTAITRSWIQFQRATGAVNVFVGWLVLHLHPCTTLGVLGHHTIRAWRRSFGCVIEQGTAVPPASSGVCACSPDCTVLKVESVLWRGFEVKAGSELIQLS